MLFQTNDGWFKTQKNDCNFNLCDESNSSESNNPFASTARQEANSYCLINRSRANRLMIIARENNVADVMGGFSSKCLHNVVASTAV